MSLSPFEFFSPTKLFVSPGGLSELAFECQKLGITRPLLLSDRGLTSLGMTARVAQAMSDGGVAPVTTFDDIPANSDKHSVLRAVAQAREAGADGVVALGGGSVLDTAKVVTLLLTTSAEFEEYEGGADIPVDLLPWIAVPTTAGTGSEVTFVALILDPERHAKVTFSSPKLAPRIALLDAELTVGLPPRLTAATAFDALTHAVEAITGLQKQPVSTALGLQAIRLIASALPRVMTDGSDIDARNELLIAATLAGMAFNNSMVGLVHAISHGAGVYAAVHHGTANAVVLPYVMEYNQEVCAEDYALIARAMGLSGNDDSSLTQALIDEVRRLLATCNMPTSFAQANVGIEHLNDIAEYAMQDGPILFAPRQPESIEELTAIVRAIIEGRSLAGFSAATTA